MMNYSIDFPKSCIIIDECNGEINLQKLKENLKSFETIKLDFSQIRKENIQFFVPVLFWSRILF